MTSQVPIHFLIAPACAQWHKETFMCQSAENGSQSCTPEVPDHGTAPESAARSPLRPLRYSSPAASLPPPPSPTCKDEESSLSPDEVPLQLMAHPVSDREESQATPMMICNFLQLTLNEPPSTTKAAAETDFMALAKQQLFVSELPTPPTQISGTPISGVVPGASPHAYPSGLQRGSKTSARRFSDLCRPFPLQQSAEQAMQHCGGLASPQPCRSSVEQMTLVAAATSPGTPLCTQASEGVSAAESSKAASEQAAVELCGSPAHGAAASPWAFTPVGLGRVSNKFDSTCERGLRIAEGTELTPLETVHDQGSASSPGVMEQPGTAACLREETGTPRLQAMGNALSPLLRDACGRSAKSVLRDLLADLVEQERALDAQASVVKAEKWPSPEFVTEMSPLKLHPQDGLEETVDVVAGSPLQRNVSLEVDRADVDNASCDSRLHFVDPMTFDAVYDEAVQLHLAAGLGHTQPQADLACSTSSRVDVPCEVPGAGPRISEAAQAASRGLLLDQDQPVSPAMTRVSTFSVRSALSNDVSHGQRTTGSTADVAAWLCPTEPVAQACSGAKKVQGRHKAGALLSRQAAAQPSALRMRSSRASSGAKAGAQTGLSFACAGMGH